jgi:hypothetical protein
MHLLQLRVKRSLMQYALQLTNKLRGKDQLKTDFTLVVSLYYIHFYFQIHRLLFLEYILMLVTFIFVRLFNSC